MSVIKDGEREATLSRTITNSDTRGTPLYPLSHERQDVLLEYDAPFSAKSLCPYNPVCMLLGLCSHMIVISSVWDSAKDAIISVLEQ